MEKLTEHIPGFRIGAGTKKTIWELARNDKRKLTEFVRVKLEELAHEVEKKKALPLQ